MKLLLDIGNSRVKWGWYDGELCGVGEFAHRNARLEEVVAAIAADGRQPDDIRIAAVGGAVAEALARALEIDYGARPEFVEVRPRACGVTVAYAHPERLGVDRWLALIAAHHGCAGAACVADAGTALTVDGILEDGTHVGGAISPGIELMQEALLRDTAGIARHALGEAEGLELFATDTRPALRAGAVHAAVGLIERAAAELDRRADERVTLFLTGGAAAMIAPLIDRDVHLLRELVLRGLAHIAASEDATDDDE